MHAGLPAWPLWHLPEQYRHQPQRHWSSGQAWCLRLNLLLPLPAWAGSQLLSCCWHVACLLQPVRDEVGPVHSSAALPGRICLGIAHHIIDCIDDRTLLCHHVSMSPIELVVQPG